MSGLPEPVERWRASGRMLDIDGRSIFVHENGRGDQNVLILHGFPGSSFDWRGVVQTMGNSARIVAFDMPGYGLSDKPFDRITLFDHADLTEKICAVLGITRCLLVSHDMGDTVAAELLSRANAGRLSFEVEHAILTNGSIFIDLAQLSAGQIALLEMPDEPLAESLPLEALKPGLSVTFSSQHQPSDEELDCMVALIAHNDGDRLLPRLIRYIEERRANQDHWTAGLAEFKGPITAIWGGQDPIAVVDMAHRLKELRPETDLITWHDVGHWPSIEVPERLAGTIADRIP